MCLEYLGQLHPLLGARFAAELCCLERLLSGEELSNTRGAEIACLVTHHSDLICKLFFFMHTTFFFISKCLNSLIFPFLSTCIFFYSPPVVVSSREKSHSITRITPHFVILQLASGGIRYSFIVLGIAFLEPH